MAAKPMAIHTRITPSDISTSIVSKWDGGMASALTSSQAVIGHYTTTSVSTGDVILSGTIEQDRVATSNGERRVNNVAIPDGLQLVDGVVTQATSPISQIKPGAKVNLVRLPGTGAAGAAGPSVEMFATDVLVVQVGSGAQHQAVLPIGGKLGGPIGSQGESVVVTFAAQPSTALSIAGYSVLHQLGMLSPIGKTSVQAPLTQALEK
ncbi:MAG: CpaB family protein [Chloroflexota bacterium]